MTSPVSHLKDPDMLAVPRALMRAAEQARRLAAQTGTPFVSRQAELPRPIASGDTRGKAANAGKE